MPSGVEHHDDASPKIRPFSSLRTTGGSTPASVVNSPQRLPDRYAAAFELSHVHVQRHSQFVHVVAIARAPRVCVRGADFRWSG